MIQVNELRIGNWVRHNKLGKNIKITGINCIKNDLTFIEAYLDNIIVKCDTNQVSAIPIPDNFNIYSSHETLYYGITGKWRFLIHLTYFPNEYDGITLSFVPNIDTKKKVNSFRFSLIHPFSFIHQLQNLYFILTGEELDVKL